MNAASSEYESTLTARVIAFLQMSQLPVSARLVAKELDAKHHSVSSILLELVMRNMVRRWKAGAVYRYELVQP